MWKNGERRELFPSTRKGKATRWNKDVNTSPTSKHGRKNSIEMRQPVINASRDKIASYITERNFVELRFFFFRPLYNILYKFIRWEFLTKTGTQQRARLLVESSKNEQIASQQEEKLLNNNKKNKFKGRKRAKADEPMWWWPLDGSGILFGSLIIFPYIFHSNISDPFI